MPFHPATFGGAVRDKVLAVLPNGLTTTPEEVSDDSDEEHDANSDNSDTSRELGIRAGE